MWRNGAIPYLYAYRNEADIIVTGRWVGAGSVPNAIGIEVTSVLKGELGGGLDRQKPPRHISVPGSPALELLLDRDVEYLFFLSSKDAKSSSYPRIRSGDGIVAADEQSLAAVRQALLHPPQPAPPDRAPRN
jgi:hypothetical protein